MTAGPPPDAVQYRVTAARQQDVIDAVLDAYAGAGPEQVIPALLAGFVRESLDVPTRPWLDAVAAEIGNHQRFIVGGAAGDDTVPDRDLYQTLEARRRSVSHELWFSHDPKIGHIPPIDAVEHRGEQEHPNE